MWVGGNSTKSWQLQSSAYGGKAQDRRRQQQYAASVVRSFVRRQSFLPSLLSASSDDPPFLRFPPYASFGAFSLADEKNRRWIHEEKIERGETEM